MNRVRTEAAISLTLAWDPRTPLSPEDAPILARFIGAVRDMAGLKGIRTSGDPSMLERAFGIAALAAPTSVPQTRADAERAVVLAALDAERYHQGRAAQRMGIHRRTLRNLMVKHGIPGPRERRAMEATTCA